MATKVKVEVPNYSNLLHTALSKTSMEVGHRVEEVAQTTAPADTGFYKSRIKFDGKDTVTAHAPYSAAIEYGIKQPVIIRPKNAKALRFTVDGKEVFAKSVQQKTRKPNPVMRLAARTVQKEVKNIFMRNFANATV